jgi:transposase InsO family protein
MPTSKGFVVGIEMLPTTKGQGNVAIVAMDKGKRVNVNDLHVLLSHVAEHTARKTANFYGWDIFGTFTPCDHCATSKARQKNINKSVESHSLIAGERLCINISYVKGLSYGNRKFWLLIVDDCVDQCWSEFLAKKSDTTKVMLMLIKDLKARNNKIVKYIQCDNAGENHKLEEACKREGLGIQFEYTAPGTPQQNGRVERKFATLYARVRAMLNHALLPSKLQHGLWAEAAAAATLIENTLVTKYKNMAPHTGSLDKNLTTLGI